MKNQGFGRDISNCWPDLGFLFGGAAFGSVTTTMKYEIIFYTSYATSILTSTLEKTFEKTITLTAPTTILSIVTETQRVTATM